MLVVLDSLCLTEALTVDTDGVKKTLIDICDQIVFSERILGEYTKEYKERKYKKGNYTIYFSGLRDELEKLKQMRPKKAEERKPSPAKVRGVGSQHRVFIKDAIGLKADYFITKNPTWLKANIIVESPKGCNLRIVTPGKYVQEKKKSKKS